jgi:hypothetical protein
MSKISVNIPAMQPYEGKATQKQKQKLWDMGYEDQSVIDGLGKRQASALIEQLKQHEADQVTAWKWLCDREAFCFWINRNLKGRHETSVV